jgi:hypothetical protein
MKEILKDLYTGIVTTAMCSTCVLAIIAGVLAFKYMLQSLGILAIWYFVLSIILIAAGFFGFVMIGIVVNDSVKEENEEDSNENTN